MKRDEVRRLRAHVRNMSARAASELPPGPLGVPAWSRLTPRQAIRGDAGGENFGAPSPSLEGELFDMTLRVRAARR
jgi:hypothetical protein